MKDRSRAHPSSEAPEDSTAPAADPAPQGESAEGTGAEAQERGDAGSEPRVQELTAELDALRDRYLRTVAEYDNFRRRTERERAESSIKAQAQVVEKLLDALDDLQRVADFTEESTTVHALLEGVQMVERKLLRELQSAGLEIIDAQGQRFDPALHEALMTGPTQSREEDESVGQVFQQGYQFRGILLRPARVQVRKYGE